MLSQLTPRLSGCCATSLAQGPICTGALCATVKAAFIEQAAYYFTLPADLSTDTEQPIHLETP